MSQNSISSTLLSNNSLHHTWLINILPYSSSQRQKVSLWTRENIMHHTNSQIATPQVLTAMCVWCSVYVQKNSTAARNFSIFIDVFVKTNKKFLSISLSYLKLQSDEGGSTLSVSTFHLPLCLRNRSRGQCWARWGTQHHATCSMQHQLWLMMSRTLSSSFSVSLSPSVWVYGEMLDPSSLVFSGNYRAISL